LTDAVGLRPFEETAVKSVVLSAAFFSLVSAVTVAQNPPANSVACACTWGTPGGTIPIIYSGTYTYDNTNYVLPEVYTERVTWNAKTNSWDVFSPTTYRKHAATNGNFGAAAGQQPPAQDLFAYQKGATVYMRATLTAANKNPPSTVQVPLATSVQTMTMP
jgi:hypothetical protein